MGRLHGIGRGRLGDRSKTTYTIITWMSIDIMVVFEWEGIGDATARREKSPPSKPEDGAPNSSSDCAYGSPVHQHATNEIRNLVPGYLNTQDKSTGCGIQRLWIARGQIR